MWRNKNINTIYLLIYVFMLVSFSVPPLRPLLLSVRRRQDAQAGGGGAVTAEQTPPRPLDFGKIEAEPLIISYIDTEVSLQPSLRDSLLLHGVPPMHCKYLTTCHWWRSALSSLMHLSCLKLQWRFTAFINNAYKLF